MSDHNKSRISRIYGSMNSMYYVEPALNEHRYLHVKGQHPPENLGLTRTYMDESFNSQIQISSFTAWILLLTSVLFSAFVPCWLLADVASEPLTRNSWRYFTVSLLLLPFLFHEQRTRKTQEQKFWNQLTPQKMKPIFLGSLNFCLWLICLIYACRNTSMNHALCLSYLRFYLISMIKIFKGQRIHQFQIAGCILCTIGVTMVMTDSVTPALQYGYIQEPFVDAPYWKRLILGDGLGVFASFVSVYLDHHFKVPEMPRFTYLYLYNLFLSFNLVTSGYFFGGSDFTFDTKFGIFGLFTYQNFVSVFYVSIMLGFYLVIVNLLISQIFNDVIINAGFTFQLILTSLAWHGLGLQPMPARFTCLGYAFITPGLIFAIGGQGAVQNKDNKMNFELYRPTQVHDTYIQSEHGRISQDKSSDTFFDSPMKEKEKTIQKMPFEMILQQDQNQGKNVKND